MLRLDHLAVSATDLAEGVAWLEDRLGIAMAGGGQHALMGTHNRLAGMCDLYLEVIAVDPVAPAPAFPRWFDLDRFDGAPRLTNWILACDDMAATLAAAPLGAGRILDLARGDFRWQMAVPDSGILPLGGAYPALIRWLGGLHPAPRLPETGLRLHRLEIATPEAAALRAALPALADPRLQISDGPGFALRAEIDTPHGRRVLE